MRKLLMGLLGRRFMERTLGQHTQNGGALDVRFGLSLLKDRRVPVASKITALAIGVVVSLLLIALEIPLEMAVALMMPVIGLFGDAVVDGLEAVVVPLVVAALLLQRLAPQHVVEQLRAENARQVPYHDVSAP